MTDSEKKITRSDLLHDVGLLVMNWSALASCVRYIVDAMSPYDTASRLRSELLIEGLGERQLIERAERMAHATLDGTLKDDVVDWLAKVETVRLTRNRLTHAEWSDGVSQSSGDDLGVSTIVRRLNNPARGFSTTVEEQTPDGLKRTNDEMAKLYVAGLHFMTELHEFSKQEALRQIGIPWRRAVEGPASAWKR